MKHPLWLLAFVACSSAPLFGIVVPLSQTAVSSVSGEVGIIPSHGAYTDSYSDVRNEAWTGTSYAVDITGTATATADPQPGWVYYLPLTYVTSSRAQQTVGVSGGGIEMTGNANAQSSAHAQVGSMRSNAAVFSEVVFNVTEAETFSLAVSSSYWHFPHFGLFTDAPVFSLTALDGSMSLTTADLTRTGGLLPSWNTQRNLVLGPGGYRLAYAIQTPRLTNDPLGESSSASMQVRLVAVSDDGAAAVLLAMGLAVLATVGRERFRR